MPQSFRMDGTRPPTFPSPINRVLVDLMREMHEIESQRSAVPPIPASTIKDQIHDDAWALQYIEDGKVFHVTVSRFLLCHDLKVILKDNVNNEAIWAEISSQEQSNTFQDEWGGECFQDGVPGPSRMNEAQQSAQELVDDVEDPKFVYSKVC